MQNFYAGADSMRRLMTPEKKPVAAPAAKPFLDDAVEDEPNGAADYAAAQLRVSAAAIAQQFAATTDDDLDPGNPDAEGGAIAPETLSDRLDALVFGAVDANKDGEISDEEAQVVAILSDYVWDYLSDKGVSDEDADALLNNGDNDAAVRVRDLLADTVPADDEAAADDIDAFAFDDDSTSPIFDSTTGEVFFDATYKKKLVVRGGQKMKINKRVSGTVRLSAKQKVAVRKMQHKSHTAPAMVKRLKSMKKRAQMGI